MGIRLRDFRARLASETDWKVLGAADFARAQADVRRDTAYVMYLTEDPNDARDPLPNQLHRYGVAVVLAVRNSRDARGEAAIDEVEGRREPVLRALIGWAPPGATGRVSYRRGLLRAVTREALWWEDQFEVPALTDL